jgi:hypothetical protein
MEKARQQVEGRAGDLRRSRLSDRNTRSEGRDELQLPDTMSVNLVAADLTRRIGDDRLTKGRFEEP